MGPIKIHIKPWVVLLARPQKNSRLVVQVRAHMAQTVHQLAAWFPCVWSGRGLEASPSTFRSWACTKKPDAANVVEAMDDMVGEPTTLRQVLEQDRVELVECDCAARSLANKTVVVPPHCKAW